ncbi:MAG: hypothetical protein WDO12_08875 [Pseudomonadota bacterium]
MKKILLACVVASISIAAVAADASLFSYSGKIDVVGGAATFVTVQEVSRTATSSIVKITGAAPVSGLNSRILTLAMCGLAKARSESYFQVKLIEAAPQTFEVAFPKTGPGQAATGAFPANATSPNTYPVSACP